MNLKTLIIVLLPLVGFSQTYVSVMPSLYTGAGSFAQRSSCDFEIGKQWDAFSAGLDIGKTSFVKKQRNAKDSTWDIELRPNLNIFQQGKFTNTLTIGIGYIFNSSQNILTEFTTGIEYTPNKHFSYNWYFGTYYFTGNSSASSNNFFGVSVMYYFMETTRKSIFEREEKREKTKATKTRLYTEPNREPTIRSEWPYQFQNMKNSTISLG